MLFISEFSEEKRTCSSSEAASGSREINKFTKLGTNLVKIKEMYLLIEGHDKSHFNIHAYYIFLMEDSWE
jgi:hypothetical protein